VNNGNSKYTVTSLFNKYDEIKIPIIQRDYAQGRGSAKEIRKDFLNTIKNNLENGLHLDFIYGSVLKNNGMEILILLDGQQRITTLFLLYWYAAIKDKKIGDFRKNFCFKDSDKSKLRYEVRPSSEEFLDYIVSDDSIEFKDNQKPSEIIKDKNWFYLGWLHDPTISGMLNMLDDINNIFLDATDLFDNLSKTHKITFDFLELNNFGLTDDLYIKMNSRGKLLTSYENFKAKLESIIKDQMEDKFLGIAKKFDREYIDFFWEIAKDNKKEGEDEAKLTNKYMYNFFYNLTLNLYALKNGSLSSSYTKLEDFVKENPLISFYKEVYKNNLDELIKFLDKIIKRDTEETMKVIKPILSDNPSLWDRIRFHAFYLSILYHENDRHWYRVLKNLINNTLIQSEDYIKALKAIQEFSNKIQNVGKVLEHIKDKDKFIEFFSQNQQKEEKLKAVLIFNNNGWDEEIKEAENDWYLDGKVGFFIEFSKKNGNYNLESFKQYRDKFISLWKFAKQSNDNQILLYQVLLTKGDYLPQIGHNKTFCSFDTGLRAKSESWHRVFESDEKEYLKALLDDINLSNKNIKSQLENIIKTHSVSDWRKYFIENPSYIEYCEKLQLRFDDDKIYLLKYKQMNGRHVELYSWHLFNKCFELKPENERIEGWKLEGKNSCEPFKEVEYVESTSYEEPYILLSGWKCELNNENYELLLKIWYEGGNKFNFKLEDAKSKELPNIKKIQCKQYEIEKEGTFNMTDGFANCCRLFIKNISKPNGDDSNVQP